jgi:NAD-dependent SIR2 family protein deacetylase
VTIAANPADSHTGLAGDSVVRLLAQGSVVVLSGAGLSTSCGIPDYRDHAGRWKRAQPISHQDFLRSDSARRRYWARSFLGWPTVAQAAPGRGHQALAQLESVGRIRLIVTQNVDGLHRKAGSNQVLELHGGLDGVVCLSCQRRHQRAQVQEWLGAANPQVPAQAAVAAPDGDAQVAEELYAGFQVPDCPACGGMLKPDVVFFGDSVPRERVSAASEAIAAADGLLVVGSSLMVYSGFRFVEIARRAGKPVMAVNLGTTRADPMLDAKVEADCDEFLDGVQARLMRHC